MARILSDFAANMQLCPKLLYSTITGLLHYERLWIWLEISFAYFLMCFISIWKSLMRSPHARDVAYWLANYFGYFCTWILKCWKVAYGAWTDFWSQPQVRRYLYECNLSVWQLVYGMPNTGRIILFNGWHDVCFCCTDRVGQLIEQAKVCLDVALLSDESAKHLNGILAAHSRAVNVRVLASDKMLQANGPEMLRICAAGVPLRSYAMSVAFGYNFAIIDSERRALEIEAGQDTQGRTRLWLLRDSLKGFLKFLLLAVKNNGKNDYRNDSYHFQHFFAEWKILYPITPDYLKAYNYI
ncbi:uncharacterized protein LOC117890606 [Drosophila subobscura]|uniref:uncharacterized protein LOC117890606 n=1 Tax=Drosophila subobscura TaxID=7241 RepID=UPI00155A48D9|nr:uncharacterized protein LOC117890606 [Drosophila subobscura]